MADSIYEVDQKLSAYGPIRRYESFEHAGIDITRMPIPANAAAEVEKWRDKINRILEPRTPQTTIIRDTHGFRFSLDDYLENDPECFRRKVTRQRISPIRIGINLSAAYGSWHLNAMRGGAILAFTDVLNRMGLQYDIDMVYGNGRACRVFGECHIRVALLPYSNVVSHACLSDHATSVIGEKLVNPLAKLSSTRGMWAGGYRLHEYEALGIKEFDFVLDRIESDDINLEFNRIVARLKALGICD